MHEWATWPTLNQHTPTQPDNLAAFPTWPPPPTTWTTIPPLPVSYTHLDVYKRQLCYLFR